MKTEAIEKVINERLSQLYKVKDWFENDRVTDQNNQLMERNKYLEKRNKMLEKKSVQPFTMESFDPEIQLHELEKQYTLNAIKHFKGDKTKAADALGLTIKTLYNKLHLYGEI